MFLSFFFWFLLGPQLVSHASSYSLAQEIFSRYSDKNVIFSPSVIEQGLASLSQSFIQSKDKKRNLFPKKNVFYGNHLWAWGTQDRIELSLFKSNIDHWVSQESAQRIDSIPLINLFDSKTDKILTGFFWADSRWKYPCDLKMRSFHCRSGLFGFWKGDDVHLVQIPYADSQTVLLIISPRRADEFFTLEKSLTEDLVKKWLAHLQYRQLDLTFPVFETDKTVEFRSPLSSAHCIYRSKVFISTANIDQLEKSRGEKTLGKSSVLKVNGPFLFLVWDPLLQSIVWMGHQVFFG